jgi:cell division protease FtsH
VESAHQSAKSILEEHRDNLVRISQILVRRETIEKAQFEALLDGKADDEIFGPETPTEQTPPELPAPADRAGREAPRPLPRPGLAGGGVEARGLDLPEKPELA